MEKQFSIRESIKSSWDLIKGENLFLLIGLFLGYLVVYGVLSSVRIFMPGGIIGFVVMLMELFLSMVWSMGFIKILLQISKGEEAEFSAFKDVIPLFGNYLGASILRALPVLGSMLIGFVILITMMLPSLDIEAIQAGDLSSLSTSLGGGNHAFTFFLVVLIAIIPAFYFSIRWMFYSYLIVDRNSGAIESLKQSWKMTEGNFWHLVLFILVYIGMIVLGIIALILGFFVVLPLMMMVQTLIYKKIVSTLNVEEEIVTSVEE